MALMVRHAARCEMWRARAINAVPRCKRYVATCADKLASEAPDACFNWPPMHDWRCTVYVASGLNVTVAILAQGTHWAVAATQAFLNPIRTFMRTARPNTRKRTHTRANGMPNQGPLCMPRV